MPVREGLLAALLAAFMLVTGAAPAVALSEDDRDARRDVLSGPKLSDDLPGRPEPARKVGDIVANSASYGAELTVTTRFRSLTAIGQQEFSWFLLTADDPHASWNASLVVQAGKDKGRFTLLDPIANQPGCGTATLDRAARTVTLAIPASCLGSPDWVKVGNGIYVYTATRRYADDARLDGVVKGGWKYGPKIKAG